MLDKILGKTLGGFIGYLWFGPGGLLIGILLGHFLDSGLIRTLCSNQFKNRIFYQACFTVLGKVAKADGHVNKNEIDKIEVIIARFNLQPNERLKAIHYFNLGKSSQYNLNKEISQLKKLFSGHLLKMFVEIQIELAKADGELQIQEKDFLIFLCRELNLSINKFPDLNYQPIIDSPYQVLNVSSKISNLDLKNIYRKLMSQYHPDKLTSKGLPEELLQFATQKSQKIQAAYREICKQRGII